MRNGVLPAHDQSMCTLSLANIGSTYLAHAIDRMPNLLTPTYFTPTPTLSTIVHHPYNEVTRFETPTLVIWVGIRLQITDCITLYDPPVCYQKATQI